MENDLWNRIIRHWQTQNIPIRAGVRLSAVIEFESKYNVVMPDDVRDYFMAVDGTGDETADEFLNRFWPLAEVKPVHEELKAIHPDQISYSDCFVFADHFIWICRYAVKLTRDPNQPGPVFRVTGGEPPGEQMFGSFRDFMSRYVENPKNII
jgi:hypothetical protein